MAYKECIQEDAYGYEGCRTFWENMKKDKEGHIAELKIMIKKPL